MNFCRVQQGRQAHMLNSLTGWPLATLLQQSIEASAQLASAAAGAADPLLAAPAPPLDIHCWVHNKFQKTKQQLMQSAATLVFAHLVEGTAPVWTRVSGAWRAAYIKGWSGARGVRVVWGLWPL